MAITLEANYSKKLGLPGYSSHQYMITLRTELVDLTQVEAESTRLYALLQASVDRELQKPGFVPEIVRKGNGTMANGAGGNGYRSVGNGPANRPQDGNGGNGGNGNGPREQWNCSPKQRQYILDLVEQHNLDKNWVEQLAQDCFGKPVRQLNKLEASGLIEEIKERAGAGNGNGNGRARQPLVAP